jgi:hypothetical protein
MGDESPEKKKGNSIEGLTPAQKVLTFTIVLVWICTLAAGILINSSPYRDVVANYSYGIAQTSEPTQTDTDSGQTHIIVAWLVVILCYTPTNVVFLCMSAGLLGALARIARLHVHSDDEEDIPSDRVNPLISGILRGIFVYILVIAGILVINEDPITAPSQVQYVRLAGVLSLLSFLLSYHPHRFRAFLAKGWDKVEGQLVTKKTSKNGD